MHQHYQSCIDACNLCAGACDHCAIACLAEDDVQMMADCIRTDIDCAAICRLAAGSMARGSAFVHEICELCARICSACAAECERHPYDHCRACAQACRRCGEECRGMVGLGRPGRTQRPGAEAQ